LFSVLAAAARKTEFVPTGKLRITIDDGYSRDRRPAEFRDTTRLRLEDRLPAVLCELEIRALEDNGRRQEQQREAEEKQRRWEAAMDRARHDHREAFRAKVLTSQLQQRRLVRELEEFLAELREAVAAITDEQARADAARWLDWVGEHRQNIDPFRKIAMPADPKPTAEDLKPFLRGWSPTARTPITDHTAR
jgi:hypothetical protein